MEKKEFTLSKLEKAVASLPVALLVLGTLLDDSGGMHLYGPFIVLYNMVIRKYLLYRDTIQQVQHLNHFAEYKEVDFYISKLRHAFESVSPHFEFGGLPPFSKDRIVGSNKLTTQLGLDIYYRNMLNMRKERDFLMQIYPVILTIAGLIVYSIQYDTVDIVSDANNLLIFFGSLSALIRIYNIIDYGDKFHFTKQDLSDLISESGAAELGDLEEYIEIPVEGGLSVSVATPGEGSLSSYKYDVNNGDETTVDAHGKVFDFGQDENDFSEDEFQSVGEEVLVKK